MYLRHSTIFVLPPDWQGSKIRVRDTHRGTLRTPQICSRPGACRTWVCLLVRHYLDVKTNSPGKPDTLKHHKTLAFHQAFPDSKDSAYPEYKLLVDQSVGRVSHLASPHHECLKNLSDEERVRILTSSPGLGTILRVCHIYQAPKETVGVNCPECGLAFAKQALWADQTENHFGTVRPQTRGKACSFSLCLCLR